MPARTHFIAAALAALAALPAHGMELRNLRTEPADPGIGQFFRVVFEPKVKWHESESCKLLLRIDGERERDSSRWPYVDLTPDHLAQWQGHDWRVLNRRWDRDGKAASFEWRFFTPGPHQISFQAEGSTCELPAPVTLTVGIKPSYAGLSWVMVAPRGTAVTQGMNPQFVMATRDAQARYFYDEVLAEDWRAAFAEQDPKSWNTVQEQVAQRLRQQHGARSVDANARRGDVAHLIAGRSYLLVFTQQRFAELQTQLAAADYVRLIEVDADRVAAGYANARAAAQQAVERAAGQTQAVLEALPTAPQLITGMKRTGTADGKATVCARQYAGRDGALVDAYNHGAAFKAWAGTGRGFDEITADLDQLFVHFVRGRCTALVMTGADAARLTAAAQREKLAFELLDLRDEASLLPQYQQAKGYKTLDDARLGLALGPALRPRDAERLGRFGIAEPAQAEQSLARMSTAGYDQARDWAVLAQFLEDEAAGRQRGLSAAAVRKGREADEAARAAVEREKSLKAYPYSVAISCHNGPFHTVPVYLCLVGSGSQSTLELKNCGNWRQLGADELMGDRVKLALCPSFVLRGRNASEFVLTATLKDERSGKELDRQSATRLRAIAFAR